MDRVLLIVIAVSIFMLAQNGDTQVIQVHNGDPQFFQMNAKAFACDQLPAFFPPSTAYDIQAPRALETPDCKCPETDVPCPGMVQCMIYCGPPQPHSCLCCYASRQDVPQNFSSPAYNKYCWF